MNSEPENQHKFFSQSQRVLLVRNFCFFGYVCLGCCVRVVVSHLAFTHSLTPLAHSLTHSLTHSHTHTHLLPSPLSLRVKKNNMKAATAVVIIAAALLLVQQQVSAQSCTAEGCTGATTETAADNVSITASPCTHTKTPVRAFAAPSGEFVCACVAVCCVCVVLCVLCVLCVVCIVCVEYVCVCVCV